MGDRKTDIKRKRGAKAFLQLSEADLEDSKAALKGGRWHSSCYHAEQCSEKAVKALLFLENKFVEKHEVAELLKEIAREENWKVDKLIRKAKTLEKYWNIPRYLNRSRRPLPHERCELGGGSSHRSFFRGHKMCLLRPLLVL